jgi:hypothetical protein
MEERAPLVQQGDTVRDTASSHRQVWRSKIAQSTNGGDMEERRQRGSFNKVARTNIQCLSSQLHGLCADHFEKN